MHCALNEAVKIVPIQEQQKHNENGKEVVNKADKGITNSEKPNFKCDECGALFKKEITLKKHFNTKHQKQNCRVCHVTFKNSMEVLHHLAKEHSKDIIPNISVKEKEQQDDRHKKDI